MPVLERRVHEIGGHNSNQYPAAQSSDCCNETMGNFFEKEIGRDSSKKKSAAGEKAPESSFYEYWHTVLGKH